MSLFLTECRDELESLGFHPSPVCIYTRSTETGLRDPTPKIQIFTPWDRIFTPWDRICLFIFPQFLFCSKYKINLNSLFPIF